MDMLLYAVLLYYMYGTVENFILRIVLGCVIVPFSPRIKFQTKQPCTRQVLSRPSPFPLPRPNSAPAQNKKHITVCVCPQEPPPSARFRAVAESFKPDITNAEKLHSPLNLPRQNPEIRAGGQTLHNSTEYASTASWSSVPHPVTGGEKVLQKTQITVSCIVQKFLECPTQKVS